MVGPLDPAPGEVACLGRSTVMASRPPALCCVPGRSRVAPKPDVKLFSPSRPSSPSVDPNPEQQTLQDVACHVSSFCGLVQIALFVLLKIEPLATVLSIQQMCRTFGVMQMGQSWLAT